MCHHEFDGQRTAARRAPRSRREARAALFSVAIAAASGPLQASSPPAIELAYRVDPSLENCPGESEFRRAIVQKLGFDPFASAQSIKVLAEIRRSAQHTEGVVTWSGAFPTREGERRFASALHDCADLARAIEFAITVQIELLPRPSNSADALAARPEARDARSERDSATRPLAASLRRSGSPVVGGLSSRSRSTEKESAAWRIFVGAGPLVEWGMSPGTAAAGRLFATLRREALSFELGVEAGWPTEWRNEDGGGFRARAVLGTLAGCGHLGAWSVCGLGRAGRLTVTGFGVDEAASPAGWLLQLGVRAAGSHGFGDHALGTLHAEILGMPAPWTVELNRLPVWTTPSLAGMVGIDIATPLL